MGFLSNKIWVRIFLGHPVYCCPAWHVPKHNLAYWFACSLFLGWFPSGFCFAKCLFSKFMELSQFHLAVNRILAVFFLNFPYFEVLSGFASMFVFQLTFCLSFCSLLFKAQLCLDFLLKYKICCFFQIYLLAFTK